MMRLCGSLFRVAIVASTACAGSAIAQDRPSGIIASDAGGAVGYQHGLERSRFTAGGASDLERRRVEEHGFSKVIGPDGVFATSLQNGLTIATQSDSSPKGAAKAGDREMKVRYSKSPDKHNEQVVDYFAAAGVAKDQIGGVHATTYLSSSGSVNEARPAPPKIDGYASILERKIDGKFPVADSVAWARMNDEGKVVSEWVYWPAIPAKVIADARRLEELTAGSGRANFLARLPAGLPTGKVVIRHSSAAVQGPFEAFASYDVVERKPIAEKADTKDPRGVRPMGAVVRHFDADGVERRLPQEKRDLGPDYYKEKKLPPTAPR